RSPLDICEQGDGPPLEEHCEGRIGGNAPEPIRIEPVCRGLGERPRLNCLGWITKLFTRLSNDGSGGIAAERRRLSARDTEGVGPRVVSTRRGRRVLRRGRA